MNTRPLFFFFGSRSTVRSSESTRTRTRTMDPASSCSFILRCASRSALLGVAVDSKPRDELRWRPKSREVRCNKPCECLRSIMARSTLEVVIRIARSNTEM
jgi:hypothetical protein